MGVQPGGSVRLGCGKRLLPRLAAYHVLHAWEQPGGSGAPDVPGCVLAAEVHLPGGTRRLLLTQVYRNLDL